MDLSQYFKKAEKEKWALGQFNFYTKEQLAGIIEAARRLKAPVILGTSERQSKKLGLKKIVAQVAEYKRKYRHPVFLHLDHGRSFDYIRKAIASGYDSVHFDGSHLSLKENIRTTNKVVALARKKGIPVEGEVEAIEGVGGRKGDMTNPQKAAEFVRKTKVESLAVNIGNVHGIADSGVNPNLDLKRLKEIKRAVGKEPLVLHGGSGVRASDIKGAIKFGVVKINIGTEVKQVKTFSKVKKVVEKKIKLFGSDNKL